MSEQPVKFVDTIPNAGGGRWSTALAHVEFAQALRANPLRWAEFKRSTSPSAARTAAQQVKTRRLAAFTPAGSFDAVSRLDPATGETVVYVRYVGDGDA